MATHNIQTLATVARDLMKVVPLGCIEEGVNTLVILSIAHAQITSFVVEYLIVDTSGSIALVRG